MMHTTSVGLAGDTSLPFYIESDSRRLHRWTICPFFHLFNKLEGNCKFWRRILPPWASPAALPFPFTSRAAKGTSASSTDNWSFFHFFNKLEGNCKFSWRILPPYALLGTLPFPFTSRADGQRHLGFIDGQFVLGPFFHFFNKIEGNYKFSWCILPP